MFTARHALLARYLHEAATYNPHQIGSTRYYEWSAEYIVRRATRPFAAMPPLDGVPVVDLRPAFAIDATEIAERCGKPFADAVVEMRHACVAYAAAQALVDDHA